jgi:hypothetical protein
MQKNELKELVKRYFSLVEDTSVEDTKQEFDSAELIDGTKVTNQKDSAFAVGDSLFVETAEGEMVAAPEGEHTTKSGIVVVVDSEGTITGLRNPDEEGEGSLESSETTEETFEDEKEDKMEDDEEVEMEEKVVEAVEFFLAEAIMPEIEKMKEEMANCMERVEKAEEKMKEYMSETPASESKTTSKFSKTTSIKNNEGPKYQQRRYEMTLQKLNNHKK